MWGGVSYNNQPYPAWAEVVGWLLAFMSMTFIPVFAVIQFYKAKGATLAEVCTMNKMGWECVNRSVGFHHQTNACVIRE